MDIQVDIRGFLEIPAWICYEFSDQGLVSLQFSCISLLHSTIESSLFFLTKLFFFLCFVIF